MSKPDGKTPPKGPTPPNDLMGILSFFTALLPPEFSSSMPRDPLKIHDFGFRGHPTFGPNPFNPNDSLKSIFEPLSSSPSPIQNHSDLGGLGINSVSKTSVTLNRKRLVADLLPIFTQALKDAAAEMVMGQVNPKNFVLRNMTDDEIILQWCDLCSEKYHANNPNVEDVLFDKGFGQKEWISSSPVSER